MERSLVGVSDGLPLCVYVSLTESLYVASLLHHATLSLGRLLECLTATKCADDAGIVVLTLVTLQCTLDVFALFDWYNNHILCFTTLLYI